MAGAQEPIVRSFEFMHALVFNQEKIHAVQPRTLLPSKFGDCTETLGGQLKRKCCAGQLCQQPAGKAAQGSSINNPFFSSQFNNEDETNDLYLFEHRVLGMQCHHLVKKKPPWVGFSLRPRHLNLGVCLKVSLSQQDTHHTSCQYTRMVMLSLG